MLPSSRTPEGQPNRCEVCGNEIKIEASFPPGDGLCPHCNSLLWFEPTIEPEIKPATIEATKKQIQNLSSQIAALFFEDLEETYFYEQFLALNVRALAAVGGAVWKVKAERSWWPWRKGYRSLQLVCQLNLPERLLSAPGEAADHKRLLEWICRSPSEQLVPPRVKASGGLCGGNPTNQLLLIQPLGEESELRGIMEIFCRPNEFVPTQKGYQSFVKSMCRFDQTYHERMRVGKELV